MISMNGFLVEIICFICMYIKNRDLWSDYVGEKHIYDINIFVSKQNMTTYVLETLYNIHTYTIFIKKVKLFKKRTYLIV